MRRRHQRIEQRHDVLHLGRGAQIGLLRLLRRNAERAQLFLHHGQAVALARQHHDVLRMQASRNLRRQPVRGLAALQRAQRVFRRDARCGQAVAPTRGRAVFLVGLVGAWNLRQRIDTAGLCRLRGVAAEVVVFALRLRRAHGLVDQFEHRGRIAARVVAAQQVAAKVTHKGLRGDEHLRFGAAEAIDALLGVTDDEQAGCLRAAAGTGITAEPGVQRLPLQRAGVLELVDQQVARAGVEPLLHPAAQHRIGQQAQRGALDVVHVDPATLALERRELVHQQAGEPRHALLVVPGLVLRLRGQHIQQLRLHGADLLDAHHLVAEFARAAGLGQQRGEHAVGITAGQRLFQLAALGTERRLAGAPQRLRRQHQLLAQGPLGQQQGTGLVHALEGRKRRAEMRHRGKHRALGIGQLELDAALQCRLQRALGLEPAVAGHHHAVVGQCLGLAQQARLERPPHLRHRLRVVLQQVVGGRQAQRVQQRQRRIAQQRGKPAVEGADLHRPALGQQGLVQIS